MLNVIDLSHDKHDYNSEQIGKRWHRLQGAFIRFLALFELLQYVLAKQFLFFLIKIWICATLHFHICLFVFIF